MTQFGWVHNANGSRSRGVIVCESRRCKKDTDLHENVFLCTQRRAGQGPNMPHTLSVCRLFHVSTNYNWWQLGVFACWQWKPSHAMRVSLTGALASADFAQTHSNSVSRRRRGDDGLWDAVFWGGRKRENVIHSCEKKTVTTTHLDDFGSTCLTAPCAIKREIEKYLLEEGCSILCTFT